jgi:hypothetical protein
MEFKTTNNEAKYEVVVVGLVMAKELRVEYVEMWSCSQVIVSQILGDFKVKGKRMKKYLSKVRELELQFKKFVIKIFLREKNIWVPLAYLGSNSEDEVKTLEVMGKIDYRVLEGGQVTRRQKRGLEGEIPRSKICALQERLYLVAP